MAKAKKNFTGGLSSLLGETLEPDARLVSKVKATKEITKTSQLGTKELETRATFIVNENTLEKIKAVAYWERLQIKDVVELALTGYLTHYEKTVGPLRAVPARK